MTTTTPSDQETWGIIRYAAGSGRATMLPPLTVGTPHDATP